MRYVQIALSIIAAGIAVLQFCYVIGFGKTTTNIQPLTAVFYVLFFWGLWTYARISKFIDPIMVLSKKSIRWIASLTLTFCVALAIYTALGPHEALASMMFGDRWLGAAARLLKFGREFPAKDP